MFQRLKERWKVGGWDLFLILTAFALTGSSTAWITRKITEWIPAEKWSPVWIILKFSILIIGYQLIILFWGFILGQFSFFWNYEKKLLRRLGVWKKESQGGVKIAVFASGGGTNFRRIEAFFRNHKKISVSLLVCNNPEAGVIRIAEEVKIPFLLINTADLKHPERLIGLLRKNNIDYVVLAGFLKKIPQLLIDQYRHRIINIHPALLPNFGGKGMYGKHVHEAVVRSGDKKSGITIHYVDEHYDNGDIIFQKACEIDETDTPDSLAGKIQLMEHEYYPAQIEELINRNMQKTG